MGELTSGDEFLRQLFAPDYINAAAALTQNKKRLVHYTSAENGLKMINGAEVWMRQACVMNDFMEIEHGASCLARAWRSEVGLKFQSWLDAISGGFSKKIAKINDDKHGNLRWSTFLTSVSVHEDAEDAYGRLSMWRAYGGLNGVAIVMNQSVFLSESDILKAYSAPVIYKDEAEFEVWFGEWTRSIMSHSDYLKSLGVEEIERWLIYAFELLLLCLKHPGFREEQEWRIFYTEEAGVVTPMKRTYEVINGIPQPVMRIPLNHEGLEGASVPELINRIIIGPSEHSYSTFLAYEDSLRRAGIENPREIISVSNIPLRH